MKRSIPLLMAVGTYIATGLAGIWLDLQMAGALIGDAVFSLWLTALFAVGALIAWRRPTHAVGWLLIACSIGVAVSIVTKSYANVAYHGDLRLPAPGLAAWLSHWVAVPAAGLLVIAMILFPEGRLPSRRWRWPMRGLMGAFVLASVGPMFRPGEIDGLPGVTNPYGTAWGQHLWDVSQIAQPMVAIVGAALIVSLIIRSRRAALVERQQIRWVAYALMLLPVAFVLSEVAQSVDRSREDYLGFFIIIAALLALPVSIGIAILRYRLYDIDLVINRTIVYVLLTAFLGTSYAGGIALIQAVVPIGKDNDLAVAASTLLIAALFRPARRGIQGFIDHYFYRHRYDAQRTIDAFSSRLRDEIDLTALNEELVVVVNETMQPRHVSVWLLTRGPG